MTTIGKAVADEFRRILGERKLKIAQAARDLRVSRQAFYGYLNGTSLPRKQTFARAIDLWNFNIAVGGSLLDRDSFKEPKKEAEPSQMVLWEALDGIRPQDLKIAVNRVGSTLNVEVRIDIPA
jgi:transcriptional regulator with XRE-family HTH domain